MNAKRARDLRQRGYKLKGIASVMGVTVEGERRQTRSAADQPQDRLKPPPAQARPKLTAPSPGA